MDTKKKTRQLRVQNAEKEYLKMDRIVVYIPKSLKERLKATATAKGWTMSAYLKILIDNDMERQSRAFLKGRKY